MFPFHLICSRCCAMTYRAGGGFLQYLPMGMPVKKEGERCWHVLYITQGQNYANGLLAIGDIQLTTLTLRTQVLSRNQIRNKMFHRVSRLPRNPSHIPFAIIRSGCSTYIPPPRLHKRSQLCALHDQLMPNLSLRSPFPSPWSTLSFPIALVDIPHPARALYPRALAVRHSRDSTCTTVLQDTAGQERFSSLSTTFFLWCGCRHSHVRRQSACDALCPHLMVVRISYLHPARR
ncbi:hypothetical protein BGW80DRAFT_143054 [Lactifluus volemus]|nr:hypothetical protein BGW80DRAFT_143054 [Lactifluus volemus]